MDMIIFFVLITILIIIFIMKSPDDQDNDDNNNYDSTHTYVSPKIPLFIPGNDKAGIVGEITVNNKLNSLLKQNEYLLVNLLLPLKNGYKTEIDCVLITRKGIFCIETKNWVGHISGDDDDEYWIQVYDDPSMANRKHKNPVKQNEGHCAVLERILKYRFEIYGAVIFAKLDDGHKINSDYAFTINEFKKWYNSLEKIAINDAEINQIAQHLSKYIATAEQLKQHRAEVRRRFNK